MAILEWGDNPTEIGATYAFYRALGYSDEEAARYALEEQLDRELTDQEAAAYANELERSGGVVTSAATDVGSSVGAVVSGASTGFFGSLSPAGWAAVVGGAAVLGGAVYLSWRR
jgi:hypothetical protein